MYKSISLLINLIWIADVFNLKGFECLDTTYPINFWAWVIIFLVMSCYNEERE